MGKKIQAESADRFDSVDKEINIEESFRQAEAQMEAMASVTVITNCPLVGIPSPPKPYSYYRKIFRLFSH